MVPNHLEDWTIETLETLCAVGQSESERHDFKAGLQDARGTTKLCCAFANSFGGFIVIGIREVSTGFKIEGVAPDKELYGKLIAKVRADPEIPVSLPKTIPVPDSINLVYIFQIAQSSRRPHLPTPVDERIFLKRLGSDCVPMTLEEIRYQMNTYEEKREKLSLLLMELFHIARSLEEQARVQDGDYDGSIFRFDIIDRVIVESYSLLKVDPNIIGVLDTLKKSLMRINSEKQKLLSVMAAAYGAGYKREHAVHYRNVVNDVMPSVIGIKDQVECSIKNNFGIDSPYSLPAQQVKSE